MYDWGKNDLSFSQVWNSPATGWEVDLLVWWSWWQNMCRKLACHSGLLTQARPQLKWNYFVHTCCHLVPGQRSTPWLTTPAILGLCTFEAKVSMFCFRTTKFTKSLLCVFIYVMWESPFQSFKKKVCWVPLCKPCLITSYW